ncbi:MAG TPA: serine hydrolase domain-containing protein, partial [Ferruginibacter sp.]|nr:serine hydrolase domain-containing protein [Ferruginibacter sp.]
MSKYFLFISFIAVFISCKQAGNNQIPGTGLYDSSYMPAVFTDPSRLEKIKTSFAVIDSMYKKHATDNHIPGIAFGIVVDGQLLYKNSYGYTDIEKKIPVTSASLFRIASMSKSFTCM